MRRPLAKILRSANGLDALLATVVLIVSASALAACSDSAPRQATPPGAEPLHRFTISASRAADPLVPADPFNKPAVGTRYVAVRLTIRNATNRDLTVEPARWIRAVTGNGAALDAAVLTAQPDDISAGGPTRGLIAPGGEISGLLIYEVPGGDGIAHLRYEDDLEPRERGDVSLS
ncbi:MAG: hypothetical protein DCC49_03770 [Acidobacteria bacterium]|nr:MAG: hypothetical protein DCC49_03770 [Acidobacteriota bacterium]